MSRSIWAAVVGASVFALAATLSASTSAAVQPASTHAKQASYPVPIIHHIVTERTPTLHQPTRRASAIRRQRHSAARALAQPHLVLLAPGSGYQQGAGRVRALQRRLAGLGFAPGPIDGRYGPLTTQAVKRFQSADGLTVDGIVGAHTLAALNVMPRAGLLPGAGYQQAAGSGRVRALQARLAGLGFAPGPIDGRYGPLTTQAVKRFQSAHRLTVNGIVGAHTLHALRTAQRGRVPTSRPKSVPQTHPAPLAGSAPAKRQREHSPALPVTPVLLGLAALGLATISLSYGRTRARVRRTPARGTEMAPVHDAAGRNGVRGR